MENAKVLTMDELDSALAGFTGTETYWKMSPIFPNFVITDGVKHMATVAGGGAFWLVDIVLSHQCNEKVKNAEFQMWEIESRPDKSAIVTCKEDTHEPVLVKQELDYSTFPEGIFKMYFINGVLLLPSEY